MEIPTRETTESELRKTGISVVGDRAWGIHLCLFYETKDDLLEMVLPNFKAGFESEEYCVWLTPDILTEEEARTEPSEILSSLGRDPDDRSFEIQSARDLYLADGRFDRERVRVVALGRRSARGCVAYPLCELVFRQRAIGVAEDHAIRFRLTQTDLADALGLTSVHVWKRNWLMRWPKGTKD